MNKLMIKKAKFNQLTRNSTMDLVQKIRSKFLKTNMNVFSNIF